MRSSDYNPGGRPFTGRRFLYVILAFFGVIFAANFALAYFALRDFRGVVVDSGYVASQSFNADKAQFDAQAARGWGFEVTAPGASPMVAIVDRDGAPIEGLAIRAIALRPLDERQDVKLTMVEAAPGLYGAQETLAPGRWKLDLLAEGEGPRYAKVIEFYVDAP